MQKTRRHFYAFECYHKRQLHLLLPLGQQYNSIGVNGKIALNLNCVGADDKSVLPRNWTSFLNVVAMASQCNSNSVMRKNSIATPLSQTPSSFRPRTLSNVSSTCCTEGAYYNAFRIATQRLSGVRRHSRLPLAEMLDSFFRSFP